MGTAIIARPEKASILSAHSEVLARVKLQRAELVAEVAQVADAIAQAAGRKWGTLALKRQLARLQKHEVFLAKVEGALSAGYTIMPNLNIELIAVRTAKAANAGAYDSENRPVVNAARLPAGHGEFVSPEPEFQSWQDERTRSDGKKYNVTIFRTTEHAPVDVPLVLVKSQLAQVLAEAMEAKLFDEIGLVKDGPDPFLVGRVLHPKARRWDRRGISFFLGWWFDPRILAR